MFPGFDISEWHGRLVWMWQWSNLRFVGFYLAHSSGQTVTSWTRHRHDLLDVGWGALPLWVPFSDTGINAMVTSNGTTHGQAAVARARDALFERGATLYLDVEAPINLGVKNSPFVPYLRDWMKAVRDAGYAPGVYCSRLDASHFLNRAEFRPFKPVVWPFSIAAATRAQWDDNQFLLAPTTANDWLVKGHPPDPDGGQWCAATLTVGCQYDWFNKNRNRKVFHWPNANGQQYGQRDVDWDMAKVFDPAHPSSAGVITMVNDRNYPDWAYLFGVRTGGLEYCERENSGRFNSGQCLIHGPGDIGPRPPAAVDGFDPIWASAASRRHMHVDVFLLGQDGFLRTAWINNRERFPFHPWPVNPQSPARRGSPIAAVSRAVDQLDIFYVDQGHHLVTQWWNPAATRWDLNRRVLLETSQASGENNLVAGGTNLAALPSPHDASRPEDRLDVFYISLNYAQPYVAPPNQNWNNSWNVVHAAWSTRDDWQLSRIPNLTRVAASSGVAAVRDATGMIHVVVQGRNRAGLSHARLASSVGSTWTVRNGPGPIPMALQQPRWWMSLHLCCIDDRLLLFGMINTGELAWALFTQDHWSTVVTAPISFATTRPLAYARRGASAVDIVGITEDGSTIARSLVIAQGGTVNLAQSSGIFADMETAVRP